MSVMVAGIITYCHGPLPLVSSPPFERPDPDSMHAELRRREASAQHCCSLYAPQAHRGLWMQMVERIDFRKGDSPHVLGFS